MQSRHARAAFPTLALLLLSVLLVPPSGATHEMTHRFYVYGTITNLSGLPLPGVSVTVEVPGATTYSSTPVWSGVTDTAGKYRIQVHLHHLGGAEEDSGKEMIIRVPSASIERRVVASPSAAPPGEEPEVMGWGYAKLDFEIDRAAPPPASPTGLGDIGSALSGNAVPLAAVAAAAVAIVFLAVRARASAERARVRQQELSVAKLPGVGRSTAQKLRASGFPTIPQLARASPADLATRMGLTESEAKRLIAKAIAHQKRDN